MTIAVTFKSATGTRTLAVAGEGFTLDESGLGLWCFGSGADLSLVVGNGVILDEKDPSKAVGRITGSISISGDVTLAETPLDLHDGCAKAFRFGAANKPAFNPPEWWASWAWRSLEACNELDKGKILTRLLKLPMGFAENGSTDDGGSKRVCQHRWEGAVATYFELLREPARRESIAFADKQGQRPMFYFDKGGEFVRRPDWWINEHGAQKGLHGKWARPSSAPWQLEDLEHLAPDRLATAAFAYRDPPSELAFRAYLAAMLSRPCISTVKIPEQARAVGYTLDLLALAAMAYPGDYGISGAMRNVCDGLRMSVGYGLGGAPFMALRPLMALHPSHASLTDYDLRKLAPRLGVEWKAAWDTLSPAAILKAWPKAASEEARRLLQAADVWGVAIIGRGLSACARVPALREAIPDLNWLIQVAASFVVGSGTKPAIGQDGKPYEPLHVHDSVAPRAGRAHPCNAENGGTKRYIVPAGLDMLPHLGPGLRERMEKLCFDIYRSDDDFRLTDSGPDSIRIGLPGIAAFGAR